MQPTDTDHIVYEHPLNEKTRTLLRLEHLFRKTAFYLPQGDTWASRASIDGLIDMVAIFSRADIKADLIKELDRHRGKLAGIRGSRGIDDERLGKILENIQFASDGVLGLQGQIGQSLRDNEFLKTIVILAKAGIHKHQWWSLPWIPAFAGMTVFPYLSGLSKCHSA